MAIDLRGQRITLMGLGRHGGGVGAARFLARRGATVTVSDVASAAQLRSSIAQLADVPIERWSFDGHHAEDLFRADLVVVNPAVRPNHTWLARITAAGIPTTTEIELFLKHCPAQIIAVTGTSGKSTTASLIAHLLAGSDKRVWLGGNLGGSLLDVVDEMQPDDWVVVELSSFQLARLPAMPTLAVAVILNCTPNHLDWHGDFEGYRRAKQQLLALQSASGLVVLNRADAEVSGWVNLCQASLVSPLEINELPRLPMPGEHQRQNAACAVAAAISIGCPRDTVLRALATFVPLPHRLQCVAEIAGRRFYDDSKATTTVATKAALATVAGPVWLLAGGQSKDADLSELADAIAARVQGVACFGDCAQQLDELLTARAVDQESRSRHVRLDEALDWCWQRSRPGDAILLSPACASLDQYADYVARAEHFLACMHRIKHERNHR